MNKKIKMWSGIAALCVITVVSALNLAIIFNKDSSYKLNYKEIEASAYVENAPYNGLILQTILCDDNETVIDACVPGNWEEWANYCSVSQTCPVRTPCQLYGHMLNSESFCLKYCTRAGCDYSEPKVPCDSI